MRTVNWYEIADSHINLLRWEPSICWGSPQSYVVISDIRIGAFADHIPRSPYFFNSRHFYDNFIFMNFLLKSLVHGLYTSMNRFRSNENDRWDAPALSSGSFRFLVQSTSWRWSPCLYRSQKWKGATRLVYGGIGEGHSRIGLRTTLEPRYRILRDSCTPWIEKKENWFHDASASSCPWRLDQFEDLIHERSLMHQY